MYSSLDCQRREIRVVTVKAGVRTDEIQCYLNHVSLDDSPIFEALSYVWGSPDNRRSILLDDQPFSVTSNLGLALQYLRFATEDRVIWIDAICINQNDFDERSSQVQLMRDIYSKARRVVSWLGEENSKVNAALASWLVWEAAKNRFSSDWITNSILEEDKKNFMRSCFVDLALHLHGETWDYWNRTWITQEIALAQDGILQCGENIIPFDPLKRLCNAINDTFWIRRELAIKAFEVRGPDGLRALANVLRVFRDHEILKLNGLNTPLYKLLCDNHDKMATDPRDKVYSLLGLSDLASSPHPGIRIDYRRSVREVYMGVVEAIVDTTSKLDILCFSCPETADGLQEQTSGVRRADLPSWTPNWSRWTGPLIQDDVKNLVSSAAMDSPASVEFRLDEGIMNVAGFCVGTISKCGVTNPTRNLIKSHGPEYYIELYDIVASWHRIFTEVSGYTRELDLLFFRTLNSGNDRKIHMDEFPKPSMDQVENPQMEESVLKRNLMLEKIQESCEEKAFFLIENTTPPTSSLNLDSTLLVGVAFSGIREGDLVCVLLGCFLPVIIRPLGGSRYRFVGPAYVHNLMNGKAIEGLENGEYELDSYELE